VASNDLELLDAQHVRHVCDETGSEMSPLGDVLLGDTYGAQRLAKALQCLVLASEQTPAIT